jgi:hypothetical protein
MILKRSVIFVTLMILSMGARLAQADDPDMGDYTAVPVFVAGAVPPNIMISLDSSISMNSLAFGYQEDGEYHPDAFGGTADGQTTGGTSTTLVDGNAAFTEEGVSPGDILHNLTDRSTGVITAVVDDHTLEVSGGMSSGANGSGDAYWVEHAALKNPSTAAEGYYGYFVPTAHYRYTGSSSSGVFVRDDAHGEWSGNFLNYLCMRRNDVAEKVLIGGKASSRDGDGQTTLLGYGGSGSDSWWFPKFADVEDPNTYTPYTNRSFYTIRENSILVYTIQGGDPDLNYSHNLTHPVERFGGWNGDEFWLADYYFDWNSTNSNYVIRPIVVEGTADNRRDSNGAYSTSYYLYDSAVDFRNSVGPQDTGAGYRVYKLDNNERIRGYARVKYVPTSAAELINTVRSLYGDSNSESILYDMFQNTGSSSDGWVTCKKCDPEVDYNPCQPYYSWGWSSGSRCYQRVDWDSAIEDLIGHIVLYDPADISRWSSYGPPADGDLYSITTTDTSTATLTATYRIAVNRDSSASGEGGDFLDGNVAGAMQRLGDRVRFGVMIFVGSEGGKILAPIGADLDTLVSQIEEVSFSTSTPLGESLYEAARYFRQQSPYYSSSDYKIGLQNGVQWDPYVYEGSEAWCLPSFVLQISDGWPYLDTNFPGEFTDGYESGYLDDVALWMHTRDHRTLQGTQKLTYYGIFAFGPGSDLMKSAARNGGFNDVNGDNLPEPPGGDADLIRREWDEDEDGVPDNYFEAKTGHQLQSHLFAAIMSMLKQTATATAVTVLSTRETGEGTLYQGFFIPALVEDLDLVTWVSFLQALWVDKWGNLRLDSNQDGRMVYTEDKIARYYYDPGEQKTYILVYSDANGDGQIDSTVDEDEDGLPDPDQRLPLIPDDEAPQEIPALWEGGKILAMTSASQRTIITFADKNWDMVPDAGDNELVDFDVDHLDDFEAFLDVDRDSYSFLDSSNGESRAVNLVNFVRGVQIPDYRNRELTVEGQKRFWKLGDIVYSTPTAVAAPTEGYQLLYGDESYLNYCNEKKHRKAMLYVGANDGMLHAFRAGDFVSGDDPSTDDTEAGYFTDQDYAQLGTEAWAYVPFNLLPHLKWLAHPDYAHVYYVDHKAKVADVKIFPDDGEHGVHPGGWGTLLIGGMRLGGGAYPSGMTLDGEEKVFRSAYFLIDVTDPEHPDVLAEISHPDLGFSTSYPAVVRVDDQWYVIFGSGPTDYVGSSIQRGKVFILNLTSLRATRQIAEGVNLFIKEADDYGIMADPISVDANPVRGENQDFVDAIYIGESYEADSAWHGKMLRIKTNGDTDPENWTLTTLIETDTEQPVTSAAAAAVGFNSELWVYFGTGRFLEREDLNRTYTQTLYGIHDRCFDRAEVACSNPQTTSSDLLDTTDIDVTAGSGVLSGATVDTFSELVSYTSSPDSSVDGWRMDLEGSGERNLSTPKILGGAVFFTSFTPPGLDICSFGGESRIYGLYFLTGTAHPKGILGEDQETHESFKSMSIGTGMPASTGLHVAGEKSGATGFIQHSTGSITQLDLTPPLKFRSGTTAWIQR